MFVEIPPGVQNYYEEVCLRKAIEHHENCIHYLRNGEYMGTSVVPIPICIVTPSQEEGSPATVCVKCPMCEKHLPKTAQAVIDNMNSEGNPLGNLLL